MRLDPINYSWSKVGELNQERDGHNVIEVYGALLVIGGGPGTGKNFKAERCNFKNGEMTCKKQNPDLRDYVTYPELFNVPDNYCH